MTCCSNVFWFSRALDTTHGLPTPSACRCKGELLLTSSVRRRPDMTHSRVQDILVSRIAEVVRLLFPCSSSPQETGPGEPRRDVGDYAEKNMSIVRSLPYIKNLRSGIQLTRYTDIEVAFAKLCTQVSASCKKGSCAPLLLYPYVISSKMVGGSLSTSSMRT